MGIICACLPSFKLFLVRLAPKWLGVTSKQNSNEEITPGQPGPTLEGTQKSAETAISGTTLTPEEKREMKERDSRRLSNLGFKVGHGGGVKVETMLVEDSDEDREENHEMTSFDTRRSVKDTSSETRLRPEDEEVSWLKDATPRESRLDIFHVGIAK